MVNLDEEDLEEWVIGKKEFSTIGDDTVVSCESFRTCEKGVGERFGERSTSESGSSYDDVIGDVLNELEESSIGDKIIDFSEILGITIGSWISIETVLNLGL